MTKTEQALHDALMVLLQDWVIIEHLMNNDPMAFKQAQDAINESLYQGESASVFSQPEDRPSANYASARESAIDEQTAEFDYFNDDFNDD